MTRPTTTPGGRETATPRESMRDALESARARTLGLLEPVPEPDQARQVSPLMSPLCWDLAHIGHYEELWLLRERLGAAATDAAFDDLYDAFRHPRRERSQLPILGPADARRYVADVRRRVLDQLTDDQLDGRRTEDRADDLAGFVTRMVVQHEHQHDETILATLQLMDDWAHPDPGAAPDRTGMAVAVRGGEQVLVERGEHVVGTDDSSWAYDNERPEHRVDSLPFLIDTTPVTNTGYGEFVADGGYRDERLWSPAGWEWRVGADAIAPGAWRREGGHDWSRVRFGRQEAVPAHEPVQHVCWFEADAYARWRGRRLPTEREWEAAAQGLVVDPLLDDPTFDLWRPGRSFAPRAVAQSPARSSTSGALDLIGGVWEWTATDFDGYPGFRALPYPEYSQVFFGTEYKVLRGGSWATSPTVARATFRNWDFPIRRQIFAGFRCAQDA